MVIADRMKALYYLAFVLVAVPQVGMPAAAQDQVVLKRGRFGGKISVVGTIDDYTGEEIRVRSGQPDAVRSYSAAEVISITTPQQEAHDRGLALLRDNNASDAARELQTALMKERRPWVRREILASMVECGLRLGDYPAAGTRFLELLRSDSATRHFRLIPLVWAPEVLTPGARSEALTWLDGSVDAARLMGASLLLEDPPHAAAARAVLRELANSADRRIQAYAQIQAWRLDLAQGTIGDLEMVRWQKRVDALPVDLRGGPDFLLGRAYAARHDYELAAATLLWLPLTDCPHHRLAARACLEAGLALKRIGQSSEAQQLFREVSARYADTLFAGEARRLLDRAGVDNTPLEKEAAP